MKTDTTIEIIQTTDMFAECCGARVDVLGICKTCGAEHLKPLEIETGTVWERVTTSRHGSATYSFDADDPEMEQRRFLSALRRAVGRRVTFGWGHYGIAQSDGDGYGICLMGTFKTERI